MRFSQHFGLSKTQPELDFVDIDPDRDMPLFLDPYALSVRTDPWSQECADDLRSFFQAAVDAIRANRTTRAQNLLSWLGEPNETCLGLSSGRPAGRGVGPDKANDIHNTLMQSRAVATGLLQELSDAELVIPGMGPDKISDITTNVIRGRLIEYTQNECRLHQIALKGTVASGGTWDATNERWKQDYVQLPIVRGRKILLVPKGVVKWEMALTAYEYYQHFVLNFLQRQELEAGSALVHILKDGTRRVTKKDLSETYPFTKEFLIDFTERHPEVLVDYKRHKLGPAARSLTNHDLAASDSSFLEDIDERQLARSLIQSLSDVQPGNTQAAKYESLIIGVLEFLFYPDLTNPVAQYRIHDGRKRIDITYDNSATSGVFRRALQSPNVNAQLVMVECKNYTHDPENPELDQLSGRFSGHTRGRLGLLVARKFENRDLFIQRCIDTAHDNRGFIIPLADSDLVQLLELTAEGEHSQINGLLNGLYNTLLT